MLPGLPLAFRRVIRALAAFSLAFLAACSRGEAPGSQLPSGTAPSTTAVVVSEDVPTPVMPYPALSTPNPLPAATGAPHPATSSPTEPFIPSPSPTLQPALVQLTSGGCCAQPFWSPDGQSVLYLDRPSPEAVAGIWRVSLQGGQPELFTSRLGVFSQDYSLRAFPQGGVTVIERLADGQRFTLANGAQQVTFSPDNQWLAWMAGQAGPPFDTAVRQVWVSRVDGSQARQVARLISGGFGGWFPDGRLLLSGRLEPGEQQPAYWVLDLEDGEPVEITRGERLRGAQISPDGEWLAYQVTLAAQPDENGLWLVQTATGTRTHLDLFGAYRWRDGQHLLVVPLEMDTPSHRLWEVEAATGQARPLTDPQVTPFKIANGDWAVAPDGKSVAFVSAVDHNIWLLSLP